MIDTHCHLTDPRLHAQLDGVLQRAKANGVTGMITIGTSAADSKAALDVARAHAQVRCAVGVHPNHAHEASADDLRALALLARQPEVVALGETGLDYHYGREHRQQQMEAFEAQLGMALESDRALVIHCRDAHVDCLDVLKRFPGVRAVFHCFAGTAAEARQVVDAGFYLGYTGVITFKNSAEQRQAVALTPMERLLVETDAPYLSPEPHRKQKVNEPALVVHVADVVGQVKEMSRAGVGQVTTDNARRLFGWGGGNSE